MRANALMLRIPLGDKARLRAELLAAAAVEGRLHARR
eukprot:CAMPEP_0171274242 /NCGR_PEP_ID=MMETSP0790-20130122/62713_1 /TAXON_ID=2925 /ORGANISM="Alexandrium catenella, Strain OF101" /LENGTH=36 /DNA_ID= /DNA_START= /DNA_END= /DNA_ORIENTATION=